MLDQHGSIPGWSRHFTTGDDPFSNYQAGGGGMSRQVSTMSVSSNGCLDIPVALNFKTELSEDLAFGKVDFFTRETTPQSPGFQLIDRLEPSPFTTKPACLKIPAALKKEGSADSGISSKKSASTAD